MGTRQSPSPPRHGKCARTAGARCSDWIAAQANLNNSSLPLFRAHRHSESAGPLPVDDLTSFFRAELIEQVSSTYSFCVSDLQVEDDLSQIGFQAYPGRYLNLRTNHFFA